MCRASRWRAATGSSCASRRAIRGSTSSARAASSKRWDRGRSRPLTTSRAAAIVGLVAVVAAGCRQDMQDQPKYQPLEASSFFADGAASRQLPQNTVARGQLKDDPLLYTGKVGDEPATEFPFTI